MAHDGMTIDHVEVHHKTSNLHACQSFSVIDTCVSGLDFALRLLLPQQSGPN